MPAGRTQAAGMDWRRDGRLADAVPARRALPVTAGKPVSRIIGAEPSCRLRRPLNVST